MTEQEKSKRVQRQIRGLFISLLALLLLTGCGTKRPSFILIVVDALRADHLSCYGYHRETSPSLDSLARSGIRWTRVQAQAPWTLPGCASILSGLTPRSHRAQEDLSGRYPISPEMPTAASLFSEEGYATVGIVNGFWVGPELGFDAGFQRFSSVDNGNGKAEESVTKLIWELERLNNDQPYFVLLHLYDVHAPYDPPAHYHRYWGVENHTSAVYWDVDQESGVLNDPENCQDYINLYDGEIRWVDDQLGRLFGWLRESGRSERTIVIVTSDHGEEFLDHGWIEHSTSLYQELLNVPLIISGSSISSNTTDSNLAGQIDILPTMLELASIEIPAHIEGLSLFSLSEHPDRILPSGSATPDHWHPEGARNRNWVAVRHGDIKLIWFADEDSSVVYNLADDPRELMPLPSDSMLLEEAMFYWATPPAFTSTQALNIGENAIEMLKGLGYI